MDVVYVWRVACACACERKCIVCTVCSVHCVFSVCTYKDIAGLEVSVDDFLVVQVHHTTHNTCAHLELCVYV